MKRFKKLSTVLAFVLLFTTLFSTMAFAESDRLGGRTRIETAVEISQKWETSSAVVLATGNDYPDALVAGPLAGALDAPVLLAYKDVLPEATKDRIAELKASTVYIVGGSGVISEKVEAELRKVVATVDRVSGANRYETAVAVAKKVALLKGGEVDKAYVVNGYDFAGALAVGPLAAKEGAVLLYADGNSFDNVAVDALAAIGNPDVTVVGDKISAAVYAAVGASERIAGADVYALGLAVAGKFEKVDGVAIAVGDMYPDALAGAALKVPMLFIKTGAASLGAENAAFLTENKDSIAKGNAYVLGGEGVVIKAVKDAVDAIVVKAPEVSSVSATDLKDVTVKFSKAVEDTSAVKFTIKRGAAIYASSVAWNKAKDTAVLTAIINLPAADYTVEIAGIADKVVTKGFTVKAETETALEIVSTTVPLADGSTIVFKVSNQYGKDFSSIVAHDNLYAKSVYNVTQGKAIALENVPGASELKLTDIEANAKVGDVLRVTISYKGFTTQANVTVIQVAKSDEISLGNIVLGDKARWTVADGNVELEYTLLNQFKMISKLTANSASAAGILAADKIQFVSSDASVISGFSTDKDSKLKLTVAGAGTAIITAIVNESGIIARTTVTIDANADASSVAINAPAMIVAAGDEAFDLAIAIVDQYGKEVKSTDGLTIGLKDTLTDAVVSFKDAKAITVNLKDVDVTSTTGVTVQIKKGDKIIGSVQFNVEPNAVVSYIDSIKFGTKFELGAEATITADDIVAIDQYGRKMSAAGFTVSEDDALNTKITLDVATFEAAAVGSKDFTVELSGKTKALKLEVIATADVKTYELNAIAPIYKSATAAYHASPVIVGKTEAGEVVHLKAGKVTAFTSSNTAVAKISSMKVEGVAAGTATITAWSGATKLASIVVTVTDAPSVPTSIEFTDTSIGGANIKTLLKIKDQYGVDITGTASANVIIVSSDLNIVDATGLAKANGSCEVSVITDNGLIATETITVSGI